MHLRHVAAHFPELGVRLDEPLQRSTDGVAKRLAIAAAVALRQALRQTLVHSGQSSPSAGGRDSHWRQRAMRCGALLPAVRADRTRACAAAAALRVCVCACMSATEGIPAEILSFDELFACRT
jgi:hypothetical protein